MARRNQNEAVKATNEQAPEATPQATTENTQQSEATASAEQVKPSAEDLYKVAANPAEHTTGVTIEEQPKTRTFIVLWPFMLAATGRKYERDEILDLPYEEALQLAKDSKGAIWPADELDQIPSDHQALIERRNAPIATPDKRKTYNVLYRILKDDREYNAGQVILLTEAESVQLVEAGAVTPYDEE